MAKSTAKKKANGKVKDRKAEVYDVGWLPLPRLGVTLSPKDAERWLSKDAEVWHDFLSDVTKTAEPREREAIGELTFWLGRMVEAASTAVRTSRAVELDSNWSLYDQEPDWNTARLAAVLLGAAARCDANPWTPPTWARAHAELAAELVYYAGKCHAHETHAERQAQERERVVTAAAEKRARRAA
jgi:hypothetical protein